MSLEKVIEREVCRIAKQSGWLSHKVGTSGFPDRVFIRDGIHVWIEFKQPGGRLSTLQKAIIKEMQDHGAYAFVCRSKDEALTVLNEVCSQETEDG